MAPTERTFVVRVFETLAASPVKRKVAMDNGNGSHSHQNRLPMPAYRHPEVRQTELRHIVGILLQRSPELFSDISALTAPPPVDERAINDGYGPYGHDFTRTTWNRLATDIVASTEEIRQALEYHRKRSKMKDKVYEATGADLS